MDKQTKQKIIREFQQSDGDVGSTHVQVAVLTHRIRELTEHLKANHQDHATRRGLITMVNRRRKLLAYLKRKNLGQYQELITRLGLRR